MGAYVMHTRGEYIRKIKTRGDAVKWIEDQVAVFQKRLDENASQEDVLETLRGFSHTLIQMTNTVVDYNLETE